MSINAVQILWDDEGETGQSLQRRLSAAGVAATALANTSWAGPAMYPVLDQRISEALRDALRVDLGGVLLSAWVGYRKLSDAATRSCATPGKPVDVVLAEHEISSTHHPTVDVQADGMTVCQLTFDLVLTLLARGLVAVVNSGYLTDVRGFEIAVHARLEFGGTKLAERERVFLPGAVLRLGHGVPLVSQSSATPPGRGGPVPAQAGPPSSEHLGAHAGAAPTRWRRSGTR